MILRDLAIGDYYAFGTLRNGMSRNTHTPLIRSTNYHHQSIRIRNGPMKTQPPIGHSTPRLMIGEQMNIEAAQEQVLSASLRVLQSRLNIPPPSMYEDMEAEYASDSLIAAARTLCRAYDDIEKQRAAAYLRGKEVDK